MSLYGFDACVDKKYEIIKQIGYGAFGSVCSARKIEKRSRKVAIKKVDLVGDVSDLKRTLREIKLLRFFHHENIVPLIDLITPATKDLKEIYIVTELMSIDLHRLIYSNLNITDTHIQLIIYQIFRGLKYIHSGGVFHRDLKPNNILINSNCDLKICDFGMSRVMAQMNLTLMESVTTRWYRAPEGLLKFRNYTDAVDVWSVGCILSELLTRKTLFPGKSTFEQIDIIIDVLGTPDEQFLKAIPSEESTLYIRNQQERTRAPLSTVINTTDELAIDLLEKIFVWDPTKRITVTNALNHPFLRHLHDPEDEPVASTKFSFEYESDQLTKEDFLAAIYQETLLNTNDTES